MKRMILLVAVLLTVAVFGCGCGAQSAALYTEADEKPCCGILILTSSKKLFLFCDGELFKTYPVAVGRASDPTPKGDFTVRNKIRRPYAPAYGSRWIGLSTPNIGIHGTNAPDSIGTQASSGCIRMRNEDIEEVFPLIQIGAWVFIM